MLHKHGDHKAPGGTIDPRAFIGVSTLPVADGHVRHLYAFAQRNNGCRSPIRRLQSNVSFAVVLLVHSGDLAALCLRVHRQRDIMESINSGYFAANQFPAHRARGRGFMILPKAPKG